MDKDFFKNLSRSAQEQYLLQDEIIQGKHGPSCEIFMTTKRLAELRMVSIVTAHNIMTGLCNNGYIELRGKKYYLDYDKIAQRGANVNKLLGLRLPKMNNEFYSTLSDTIVKLVGERGYRVLTMTTAYNPKEERRIHGIFVSLSLAGIISCGPTASENAGLYQDCPLPHVVLGNSINVPNCASVQVNSFSISQKVGEHLISGGYHKFLYVGSDHLPLGSDIRYAGFRMGLNQGGYVLGPDDVVTISPEGAASPQVLSELIQHQHEPVGVFCNNDLIAAKLYNVCHEIGKRIPEDIGIVGFDDLSIATVLEPPLSTVHYRITTMVDTAIKQLMLQINNDKAGHDNFYIEPTLIVRESSCPQVQ
ncbi:MAG: substrate-binding domain-containing protein [Clostridia bacterium]